MPDETGVPYQVVHSRAVLDCLARWGKRAKEVGVLQQYEEALTAVEGRLKNDPENEGRVIERVVR